MSYTKECDNCKEKILMQQVNGKWGAYDPSRTSWHKCGKNKNAAAQREDLSLEEELKKWTNG